MRKIPFCVGTLLWGAATAFLLEEAWHAGRFDVATMATPVMTCATVTAAVFAHMRLREWRLLGGCGFLMLALLGSIIMVSGTLARLAESKDAKEATLNAGNRAYGLQTEELATARADAKRECKSGVGQRCKDATARVDRIAEAVAAITVRSIDPKADSIARLATLLGFDGKWIRELVAAFDPILLPFFMEVASVAFFAGAFPHRPKRRESETVSPQVTESVEEAFSRTDALSDFRKLKASGSQQFLAQRWGVSESTVSKWMAGWESDQLVRRNRVGKERAVRALPAPARA